MNKDTYLILTEMKWVFLGCTNSLETQQEGQTRKQNFVEEKGSRLLPQNVLSGEKKKSAKFTPLLFQTLIECKTNKHWNEKRGENTYFMWEKKAQYPLQNKNADFLSLSRSASQQQTLLTASFWADWKHSDYFQRSSPSLVVMFGCNWNFSWEGSISASEEEQPSISSSSFPKHGLMLSFWPCKHIWELCVGYWPHLSRSQQQRIWDRLTKPAPCSAGASLSLFLRGVALSATV